MISKRLLFSPMKMREVAEELGIVASTVYKKAVDELREVLKDCPVKIEADAETLEGRSLLWLLGKNDSFPEEVATPNDKNSKYRIAFISFKVVVMKMGTEDHSKLYNHFVKYESRNV